MTAIVQRSLKPAIVAASLALWLAPVAEGQSTEPSSLDPGSASSSSARAHQILEGAREWMGGRDRMNEARTYVAQEHWGIGESLLYRWGPDLFVDCGRPRLIPSIHTDVVMQPVTFFIDATKESSVMIPIWGQRSDRAGPDVFLTNVRNRTVLAMAFSSDREELKISNDDINGLNELRHLNPVIWDVPDEEIARLHATVSVAQVGEFRGRPAVAVDIKSPTFSQRRFFDVSTHAPLGLTHTLRLPRKPGDSDTRTDGEVSIEQWRQIDGLWYPSELITVFDAIDMDDRASMEIRAIGLPAEAIRKAAVMQLPGVLERKLNDVRDGRESGPDEEAWREVMHALLDGQNRAEESPKPSSSKTGSAPSGAGR